MEPMAPAPRHVTNDDEQPAKRARTRPEDSYYEGAGNVEEPEEESARRTATAIERHVRTTMPLLAAKQVDANDIDASLRDKQRPPLSYARLAALAIVHLNGRAKVGPKSANDVLPFFWGEPPCKRLTRPSCGSPHRPRCNLRRTYDGRTVHVMLSVGRRRGCRG